MYDLLVEGSPGEATATPEKWGGGGREEVFVEVGDNWKVSLFPSKLGLEIHPPGTQVTCPGSSDHWVLAVFALDSTSEP